MKPTENQYFGPYKLIKREVRVVPLRFGNVLVTAEIKRPLKYLHHRVYWTIIQRN